jgi:hypothetical protein
LGLVFPAELPDHTSVKISIENDAKPFAGKCFLHALEKGLMKKIILLLSFIPATVMAQEGLSDGIYSSPNCLVVKTATIASQNQTAVLLGNTRSDIKLSMTSSAYEFPKQAALNVYPNPAVSDVRAVFTSRENGLSYTLQMVSQEGRSLLQRKGLTVIGNNLVQLDMSSYPTGTYYLQLFVGNGKETVRFLKVTH